MDTARHDSSTESRPQVAALIAALWVALIYATIPLVRTVQSWYAERFHRGWIIVGVLVVMTAILVITGRWLIRSARHTRPLDFAVPVVVVGIAAWWAWQLRAIPEEAIHLLEYGILAVLLFRAMRPANPDLAILVAAVLLATLMSTVDELIQWITPRRFWDFRDIAINGGAAILAAVAARRLDPGPWRRPPARSVQLALRFTVAQLLLLTLCLANTPTRVAWYSSRVPFLGFLSHPANEMAEYGHLHEVPGVGAFKSRLTLTELVDQDQLRAGEVAPIVDTYPDKDYRRFVNTYQGFEDPLLYESRIHIFSRDYHIRQLRSEPQDPASEKSHLTISYRENQILERYFPNTLRLSAFSLPQSKRATLETANDPDQPFVSKTGSHLITRFSEPALRVLLLSLVVLLIILGGFIGARQKRAKEASP